MQPDWNIHDLKLRCKTYLWLVKRNFLIHSAGSDQFFAHVVRTSVPTFQNLRKQNKFQKKIMFATGETVSLAEWINDDSYLFLFCLFSNPKKVQISF